MSRRFQCLCAALAVASAGCSSLRTADLGYTSSPATGRQQLMVRGRSTTGDENLLWGYEIRARVGPTAQQVGAGLSVVYQAFGIGSRVIPHVGVSALALELGRVDKAFEIGSGEPFLELGMTWMVENDTRYTDCTFRIWTFPGPSRRQLKQEGWGLTLASGALVDVRFTGQPQEIFWVVTLGASEVTRIGPCIE